METIGTALEEITRKLTVAGIEEARREARLLMCHALNIELQVVIGFPERKLSGDQQIYLASLCARREKREPLSQIVGSREFWSLSFKVTRDTLTPRPDSETLIEAVLNNFPDHDKPLRMLDLGVGTGCLILSALSEYPNATGLGVDISTAALNVARENAQHLKMETRCKFQTGNWADGLTETFDLILSNPPYIALTERDSLDAEVRDFEPATALFAGQDGLEDYKKLAKSLENLLRDPHSRAIIELGAGQAKAVSALMEKENLCVLERPKDLGGHIRCLVISKKT